jgi:hypothetical protein
MTQRHFFATPSDLQTVFEQAEAKGPFCYALAGVFDARRPSVFASALILPTLREPAASQTGACATYVIVPAALEVRVRPVPQAAGGVKYAVDQLENPDSATLTHGGLFAPGVLISGRVATVSATPTAKKIQSAFSNAIHKSFVRVNAYYVGPNAYELLQQGCRLTFNADAPREYDLERPRAGA